MAWTLIQSYDYTVLGSTAHPIDFTGLGGYHDLLVVAKDIVFSASAIMQVRLSVDGGSSYYATAGDYVSMSDAGAVTNADAIRINSTASNAARSGSKLILASNLNGVPKVDSQSEASRRHMFKASLSPVDALRFMGSAAGNITGGQLYMLGRN